MAASAPPRWRSALQSNQGIVVSGIAMVSPMLEGQFQFGGDRFALGAALRLPSLAAAELERKGTFSPAALAQAEHFALTDYLTTLAGPPPKGDAAQAFYARGRPDDRIAGRRDRPRTRLHPRRLCQGSARAPTTRSSATTMRPSPSTIPIPKSASARGPDPFLDGFIRAYGSAFVGYARDELGFKTEMTYNLLAAEVSGQMGLG